MCCPQKKAGRTPRPAHNFNIAMFLGAIIREAEGQKPTLKLLDNYTDMSIISINQGDKK
jgi:hypothetical protein